MAVTNWANCPRATTIGVGAIATVMALMIGTDGGKLMDFYAEKTQTAIGSIQDSIVKTTNWTFSQA